MEEKGIVDRDCFPPEPRGLFRGGGAPRRLCPASAAEAAGIVAPAGDNRGQFLLTKAEQDG